MSDENTQITIHHNPFAVATIQEAMELADIIAKSGMCGMKTAPQVLTAMKMANDTGINLTEFLRRNHVMEDGKVTQKSRYMQEQFMAKGGHILWHVRDESVCAATFRLTAFDEKAKKRSHERFLATWELTAETDPTKRSELIAKISELSDESEVTTVRTIDDAITKGIAEGRNGMKSNWKTSPRQMLHARVVSEGAPALMPGLGDGMSETEAEDMRVIEVKQQATEREERRAQMGEKEQLEWMISEKLAKAAMDVSPSEKSRLLGEAADLRTQLHEKYPESIGGQKLTGASVSPASDLRGMETAPTASDAATAMLAAQGEATEPPLIPAETTIEPPPEVNWREYKIQCIKTPAYKGRPLFELTADEIDVLYEKRSKPHLESADKKLRTEAKMIKLAYEEIHK